MGLCGSSEEEIEARVKARRERGPVGSSWENCKWNAKLGKHVEEYPEAPNRPQVPIVALDVNAAVPDQGRFDEWFDSAILSREYADTSEDYLGSGSYATVFRCRSRGVEDKGKVYAVKVIDEEDLAAREGEVGVEGLITEIAILKLMKHKNIISMRAFFRNGHSLHPKTYIVTDMLEGGELLDRVIEKQVYSERDARDCVGAVLDALCWMHERGVVHRDLKPQNLLLVDQKSDTKIKIADFGYAQHIPKKRLKDVCGTPLYQAPEIIANAKNVIKRQGVKEKSFQSDDMHIYKEVSNAKLEGYDVGVDIWALGTITYVLLCGFHPFREVLQEEFVPAFLSSKPVWRAFRQALCKSCKDVLDGRGKMVPRETFDSVCLPAAVTAAQQVDDAFLQDVAPVETSADIARTIDIFIDKSSGDVNFEKFICTLEFLTESRDMNSCECVQLHLLYLLICRGAFNYDCWWKDVSDDAKHCVQCMITVDQDARYTAHQVRDHPWFRAEGEQRAKSVSLHKAQDRLRKERARRRFKAAINLTRGVQKMRAMAKKDVVDAEGGRASPGDVEIEVKTNQ